MARNRVSTKLLVIELLSDEAISSSKTVLVGNMSSKHQRNLEHGISTIGWRNSHSFPDLLSGFPQSKDPFDTIGITEPQDRAPRA